MESAENRFAHLLQPIRELTKNWDIDVASELNDYLEELDEICITVDGGTIKLNFAEAALLIQGSTCIYSKKVELLYNLVYQTMDYINDKNKRRNKAVGRDGNEDADGVATDDNDDADFLVIDSSTSEESQEFDSTAPVRVVPLAPGALILPETHEKQKLPLISIKGEVQGSQKDYRINTFIPRAQGHILLSAPSTDDPEADDARRHRSLGEPSWRPGETCGPPEAPQTQVADGNNDDDGNNNDDGNNDDDGGFMPLRDDSMEMGDAPEEHIDRQQAASEGRVLRERREVRPAEGDGEPPPKAQPPRANPWMLHNLYDIVGEDQPLKTGKCYKVPDGLDDGGKRKRRRPDSLQDFSSWFTGLYDPPQHKLKSGPTFTDLNYIYLSKVKDKMKTRRRINRKAGVLVSDKELMMTFLLPAAGAQSEEENDPEENRHLDLQGGGGDDLSDDDHEPLPEDIPAEFGGGHEFITLGHQGEELSYEDLVKKSVEQFLINSKGYAQETALSRRVKAWEDKLRPELVLQEERSTFDIHDYSDRLVAALGSVGRYRTLASIVRGLDNFEACKYMLASLQLANDYTVEISSEAGLEESLDTMGLTLLSTHRATERFNALGSI